MKAVVIPRFGDASVLEIREVPRPEISHGQVRVKVKAVALNHLDLWVRRGHPGIHVELPFIPGSDISGIVESVGDGVRRCTAGQEVVLYPATFCNKCAECLSGRQNMCRHYSILGENAPGGLAEEIVVPEEIVFPKPVNLSFQQAAAFPLAWLTSWHMLADKLSLEPGTWMLIQAAASGTGLAALQIAKLFGSRVIATAGSEHKIKGLHNMGADVVVNYKKQNLRDVVKHVTQKRGCRVAMDHVGADTFASSISSLSRGGTYITCGGTSGSKLELDVRHLFIKHLKIIGSTMGNIKNFEDVLYHIGTGDLFPVIHKEYSVDEIVLAHKELENRAAIGKVVISM
jgi:NADPH:quinone reductase-like Zn-dependent oxidoreductase